MPITRLRANLQLKPDSVTSLEIKDQSITEVDIAPGSLHGDLFLDGTIPASKFDLSSFAGNGLVVNPNTHALDVNIDTVDLQIIADKLSVTAQITQMGNIFNGPAQLLQLDGSGNLALGQMVGNSLLDVNGAVTLRYMLTPPAVAPGAAAVMYYNAGIGSVMLSKAGSAYTPLLDGSNFVDLEEVTGAIDGINTVFTLANQPIPGSVKLFLNGLLQMPGAGKDYTISGNVITMLTVPSIGSRLVANYRK